MLSILSFVRPTENSVFEVHEIKGVELLIRLRLHFSQLNKYKFRYNFNDTINPMCSAVKNPKQLSTTSCVATFIKFID